MSEQANLLKLAEACEQSRGPDRKLDVAIVYALHPNIGPYEPHCSGEEPIFWRDPYRKQRCPKFTSSIDAAIKLIPNEWTRSVDATEPMSGIDVRLYDESGDSGLIADGSSKLEALAICAAALRAISLTIS